MALMRIECGSDNKNVNIDVFVCGSDNKDVNIDVFVLDADSLAKN